MTLFSPELSSKLAILRHKAAEGTATPDDLKEAILMMRQGRQAALAASEGAKRKTAKAAIPNADALLDELLGPQ